MDITVVQIDAAHVTPFSELLPNEFEIEKLNESDFLLGALNEKAECCGVLLSRFAHERYEIIYMGTHPAFRGQGIQRALLDSFLTSLYMSGALWPVSVTFPDDTEFEVVKQLFTRLQNFKVTEAGSNYRIPPKNRKTVNYNKLLKLKGTAKSFFEYPEREKQEFLSKLARRRMYHLEDKRIEDFEQTMCYYEKTRAGQPAAIFFARDEDRKLVTLEFFYIEPGGAGLMAKLLSATCNSLELNWKGYTLQFLETIPEAQKIAEYFFADAGETVGMLRADWDFSI